MGKTGVSMLGVPTEEVEQFNSCYYISTDRKALKEKGKELKELWLNRAQERVDKIKEIKI